MSGPKLNSYFHYVVYSSQNPVWWLLYLGPSLCAQGGFSHQMAIITREPWFKVFLSAPIPCCLKWARDLWATFPPNPVRMEPRVALLKSSLLVVSRALHSIEEIDKLIALSAALLLSRDAWLLLLQGDFHVCCFPPMRHAAQMEVISFEVVLLEAQEQSNCISSSFWVEMAEEGAWLGWAAEKKTQRNTQVQDCKGHMESEEASLTAFK